MSDIYFPSCNFTKASPEAAKKLKAYLSERMPVAGCCRVDKSTYSSDVRALYFCQACRETLESRPDNPLDCENLIVYLNGDRDFPWPSHKGLTVTVQDCWRDRNHPEIFKAVREALEKMDITVREMEENRERSTFCGDLHFEPKKPENIGLMAQYPQKAIYEMPPEVNKALMAEQVEKLPCSLAVTYCNRCTAGIINGGGKAVHIIELAMNTYQG